MKKYLLILFLTILCMGTANAENKPHKAFLCGFAASFNDSTVYFTDIQELDSVYIDSRTHFLYSRENYSYQLREYLQQQGFTTPTCITLFALTRKEIEKKLQRLRKRYTNGKYIVKEVKAPDFVYEAIKYDE